MAQRPEVDTTVCDCEIVGADTFKFTPLARQWVKESLVAKRQQLQRARGKEIPGSLIHELRGKELANLDVLIGKF